MRPDDATDDPDGEPEDPEFEQMLRDVARPDGPRGQLDLLVPGTLGVSSEALDALSRAFRASEPRPGDVVDERFRIERELGRGGMGVVYAAINVRTGGSVAIKRMMLNPTDRDAVGLAERFRREARAAARTRHPNVVEVYDVGGPDVAPYLVMELLQGESLRTRLAHGPLSVDEALAWMDGVLSGVSAAHRANVVHRDLKPDNIFLCEAAGRVLPKVLDFGVASLRDDAGESLGTLTRSGAIVGTPSYMAPEQLTGRPVDAGTDVYALGVVLYEMLTGTLPFVARSASELAVLQATQEPRPLSAHRDLPLSLERVLKTALARERRDRFPDAEAFRHALHEASQAPQTVAVHRRWPLWAVAVVLLGALTAWSRWSDPEQPAKSGDSSKLSESTSSAAVQPQVPAAAVADHVEANAMSAQPSASSDAAANSAKTSSEPAPPNSRRAAKRLPAALPERDTPSTAARKPTSLRLDDF